MEDGANIISISSDSEEDEGPPFKKFKKITPTPVTDPLTLDADKCKTSSNGAEEKMEKLDDIEVVILDDDDNNSNDTVIVDPLTKCKEITDENCVNLKNGQFGNSSTKPLENVSNGSRVLPLEKDENSPDLNLLIPVHEEPYVENSPDRGSVDGSGEESGKENDDGDLIEIVSENKTEEEIINNTEEIDSSANKAEKSDVKKIKIESTPFVLPEIMKSFMDLVENKIKDTSFSILMEKFPLMLKVCKKCTTSYLESTGFKRILDEHMKKAQISAGEAALSFGFVYDHLKEVNKSQSMEVDEVVWRNLKKLEKCIQLLTKKIQELEEAEINFDDENDEDTAYIQMDRYQKRLTQVYAKYCKLLKKNPYSGRLTYENLGFVDSEYLEINRAINNKYKNNRKFPSYHEMEKLIRKCVKEHNLELSEAQIRKESENCFRKIGELLQVRRKKELYESHYMFIKDGEDPASKDTALNEKLKKDFVEGNKKLEKVVQEYAIKQELGNVAEEAEDDNDSDNSNYVDSEQSDVEKV